LTFKGIGRKPNQKQETMPYFSRGGEDVVDDFDVHDPTPYGGGYDIALTPSPWPTPTRPSTPSTAATSDSSLDLDT
jgi:hypothetical protein